MLLPFYTCPHYVLNVHFNNIHLLFFSNKFFHALLVSLTRVLWPGSHIFHRLVAFIIFWNCLPYETLYRAIFPLFDVSVAGTSSLLSKFSSDILSLLSFFSVKGQVPNPCETTC